MNSSVTLTYRPPGYVVNLRIHLNNAASLSSLSVGLSQKAEPLQSAYTPLAQKSVNSVS